MTVDEPTPSTQAQPEFDFDSPSTTAEESRQLASPTDDVLVTPIRRVNAPESLLGYLRQVDRAVVHLLRGSPGDSVAIELIGDSAVTSEDGSTLTEESKSRTSSENPLANRSYELWNTLRNWADVALSGHVDPSRTIFQLYVSRPFSGEIVGRLAAAGTIEEARDAISFAFDTLQVNADVANPCAHLAESIRENVEIIRRMDPALLCEIVRNFRLEFGNGEAASEILEALDTKIVSEVVREPLMASLRGWVWGRVVELLERRRPVLIAQAEFRAAFISHRTRLESRAELLSVASAPTHDEVRRELELQMYVRQLDLIEVADANKYEAVIEYLTSSADRVKWAEDSKIFEQDVLEFEGELRAAWRRRRDRSEIENREKNPTDRGTLLFLECQEYRTRLAGLYVPDAYCRGTFHKLANELSVGWHPEFRMRLLNQNDSDVGGPQK